MSICKRAKSELSSGLSIDPLSHVFGFLSLQEICCLKVVSALYCGAAMQCLGGLVKATIDFNEGPFDDVLDQGVHFDDLHKIINFADAVKYIARDCHNLREFGTPFNHGVDSTCLRVAMFSRPKLIHRLRSYNSEISISCLIALIRPLQLERIDIDLENAVPEVAALAATKLPQVKHLFTA